MHQGKWDLHIRLIVWLSFIDDMLIMCKGKGMDYVNSNFTSTVDCEDIGPMKEFIRTKIDVDKEQKSLKIIQPVFV